MWTVAEPQDSLYIWSCHSSLMLDLFKVCCRSFIHFHLIAFSLQQFVFYLHCSPVRVRPLKINTLCRWSSAVCSIYLKVRFNMNEWAALSKKPNFGQMTSMSRDVPSWHCCLKPLLSRLISCVCVRKTVWGDVTSVYSKGAFTVLRLAITHIVKSWDQVNLFSRS